MAKKTESPKVQIDRSKLFALNGKPVMMIRAATN